ncbi:MULTISPECIES: hypothetical protein [Streptomyces]|uniref:hypothetical protein n=1 Tax=Streptomyces TaxID=1883 RepID=UPI000D513015|nr:MULTISPECIES: hypothetical protein [Streptomyces]PVC66972.1 hypothetical protein DBP15_17705 [Streptomyces sp. CS065A]
MTAENARDPGGVELADAVGSIRNQLVEAVARATGRTHEVAFTLSPRTAVTGEAWAIGTEDDGSTAGFGGGGAVRR